MFRSLNDHPQGAIWSLLKFLSCRIAMFAIYEDFN
jgi:hypothetical protein